MVRVEVISTQAVQSDLVERLERHHILSHYTIVPAVYGSGNSGKRLGDGVWPEENFLLITYCEKDQAKKMSKLVDDLRQLLPHEGIAFFATEVVPLHEDLS